LNIYYNFAIPKNIHSKELSCKSSKWVTQNTIWPTSATGTPETKAIIEQFFFLADLNASEAGARLADEVFTEDAELVSSTGTAKGSVGMISLHFPSPLSLYSRSIF
jgi:hypothetical protein